MIIIMVQSNINENNNGAFMTIGEVGWQAECSTN